MSAMRVLRFASAARAGSGSRPSLWRPTKCAWMFGRRPGAPCSDTGGGSLPGVPGWPAGGRRLAFGPRGEKTVSVPGGGATRTGRFRGPITRESGTAVKRAFIPSMLCRRRTSSSIVSSRSTVLAIRTAVCNT